MSILKPDDDRLPTLRQDLKLIEAPSTPDGKARWVIYDPIGHAYHSVDAKTVHILQEWTTVSIKEFVASLNRAGRIEVTEDEIEDTLEFLGRHHLTVEKKPGSGRELLEKKYKKDQRSWQQYMHAYVFFRIPLVKPHNFLRAASPFVDIFFRPAFWMVMAALALLGGYLVARQWDVFISTFFGFLSWEGAIGFAIAIALTKIAHEFGHAFAAFRYGARIPSIGIGFMLMMPILYADTTDAWRIKSRRKRMVIDAAGMGAEIIIAILATLAWHILPDGSIRSIVFFLATSSWIMTIFVNLNPLMRFDGYYLLSDALDFPNLQSRSNELGRWWLRKLLFGDHAACPEKLPKRLHQGLIIYAISVWIYRFFLFLGIALLLHGFLVKTVALILSVIEISWFIIRPILLEMREWPALISGTKARRRIMLAMGSLAGAAVFFIPWQSTIHAPATLKPQEIAFIHSRDAGQIDAIHVSQGQYVQAGDPLISLSAPSLEQEITLSRLEIEALTIRARRLAADPEIRHEHQIILSARAGAIRKLDGLQKQRAQLTIRSPINGVIQDFNHEIHPGRWVNPDLNLMRVANIEGSRAIAFVREIDLARLHIKAPARFYHDDPKTNPFPMTVAAIAPIGNSELRDPLLASTKGGRIAVREDDKGRLIPVDGIFRIDFNTNAKIDRDSRGIIRLAADRISPAKRMWQKLLILLQRESAN